MSIAALAAEFSREPFFFVEVEIGATVYRFCQARSPMPNWLVAIPCMDKAPTITPAEADTSGGTGLRASVSCEFNDFQDMDFFGTVAAPVNFWPTWRAVNPFYEGARISYFTGYLRTDTAGNDVPAASPPLGDFIRRDYVIEKFKWGRGKANIIGKDPLKLASNNRAQIPALSRGALKDPLAIAATTATLDPVGIGAQYPASGFVRVRAEVMGFTRSGDVLTLTRAQYNTAEDAHAAGDTVQVCETLSGTVDYLVSYIMQAAGAPSGLINSAAWAAEASVYLPGLYSTILTEPTGCLTLLKELAEQAPHFIYWDDRVNQVQFAAVKEPPPSPILLTSDANILEGSFKAEDAPEMRISRVFVYFGQFDPTKKLDDVSNYRQAFIRVDPASETNYGSARVKTIYSRWISNTNKAAAVRLAARTGRRFSSVPKKAWFALDPKDQAVWTGTPVALLHPDIVDTSGQPVATPFQLLSAAEKPSRYEFTGIEYLYGPSVPEDDDVDGLGKTVILSGEIYGLDLRAIYNDLFPSVLADDDIKFIFDSAAVVGGTTTGAYSVITGAWPELVTPILLDIRGLILGKGGKGEDIGAGSAAAAGSPAIALQADIRLDNSGIVGAGGRGGDGQTITDPPNTAAAAGGGGAGWPVGAAGLGTYITGGPSKGTIIQALPGSTTTGGAGGEAEHVLIVDPAFGQAGGDLGSSAVHAITTNGFTITYINAGDIRGPIV